MFLQVFLNNYVEAITFSVDTCTSFINSSVNISPFSACYPEPKADIGFLFRRNTPELTSAAMCSYELNPIIRMSAPYKRARYSSAQIVDGDVHSYVYLLRGFIFWETSVQSYVAMLFEEGYFILWLASYPDSFTCYLGFYRYHLLCHRTDSSFSVRPSPLSHDPTMRFTKSIFGITLFSGWQLGTLIYTSRYCSTSHIARYKVSGILNNYSPEGDHFFSLSIYKKIHYPYTAPPCAFFVLYSTALWFRILRDLVHAW